MLGTGVYLDDIDRALAKVNSQVRDNINHTTFWIVLITALVIIAIILLNLMSNIKTDNQLKILAQQVINTQEEERTRIARNLHDGVMNRLVGIKFMIEGILTRLSNNDQSTSIHTTLKDLPIKLKDTLAELRRIVRDLQPIALDLGLTVAIEQLSHNMEYADIEDEFSTQGEVDHISTEAKTALYRVAQEALNNIKKSAHAEHVSVKLEGDSKFVKLTVEDDGDGFDIDRIKRDPDGGFGIRNMQARMEAIGGKLIITPSPHGTTVTATIRYP